MNLKQKAFSLIELSIVVLIIGILIAGVTQGSRLVKQSRLKIAQNQTISSGIASIPDLSMWLETTSQGAIKSTTNMLDPEDGDFVSGWNDINSSASNKISVTQSVSGKYPSYVLSGINQLPSLKFNGAQYLLSNSGAGGFLPLIPGNDNFTYVTVWMLPASSTGVLFEQNNSSLVSGKRAAFITLAGSVYGFSGESNDYYVTPYTVNVPYISVVTFNSSGLVNVYSNSTTVSNSTTLNGSLQAVGSSYFSVGVKSSTGFTQEFYSGYISEIMIFNRTLKPTEIIDIEKYLSKKYAINVCCF